VDGAMNKTIKTLKNGDFEVVHTSYNIPVSYVSNPQLHKSGVDSGKRANRRGGKIYKYSVYRDC
jgi:hypothetical protein